MWIDPVSNPGPLIYASGALPTALRGQAFVTVSCAYIVTLRPNSIVKTSNSRQSKRYTGPFLPFLKRETSFITLLFAVFDADAFLEWIFFKRNDLLK